MGRMIRFIRLTGMIFTILGTVTVWVFRLTGFMLQTIILGIGTFWAGIPATADNIANQWLDRAFYAGVSTTLMPSLYYVFYASAVAMIVLAWVILSLITVWLVGAIL